MSNPNSLPSSFEAALRRREALNVASTPADSQSLEDLLRPTGQQETYPDMETEIFSVNPNGFAHKAHVFDNLAPASQQSSTEAVSLEDKLREAAAPKYDLHISPADLLRQHEDPVSPLSIIASDIDERLATENHVFTPTKGAEFVAPPDNKLKEVVLRAPHEIDFESVATDVEGAYRQIDAFDVASAEVVEAERLYAKQQFQHVVDAMYNLQGAENWSTTGKETGVELRAKIAHHFEDFNAKREAAWQAYETANSIAGAIEMSNNQLRNFNINGEALERMLAKVQREDFENNQKFGVLVSRFQQIQQTVKVDTKAGYFQKSDIDTFELEAHIASPQQKTIFDQTMRILLAGVPDGTLSDAPEAIRLQTAWSNVREVIAHQKPLLQQAILAKGKELAESIEATRAYIAANDADTAAVKTRLHELESQKREHLTGVYQPALKAMTDSLAELEEAMSLAYVRSTQVTSVTDQLQAAKQRQIEQRRTEAEEERKRTLQALGSAAHVSSQQSGRRVAEDSAVDERRFPAPEASAAENRRTMIVDRIMRLVLPGRKN